MIGAVVDTGPSHTILPSSLLEELGVERKQEVNVGFGNGTAEVCYVGEARIAYTGTEWTCPVIFGADDVYLLGRHHIGAVQSRKWTPFGRSWSLRRCKADHASLEAVC